MLRRLDKKILVGLPSSTARCTMISRWLPPRSSTGGMQLQTELDYHALAQVSRLRIYLSPRVFMHKFKHTHTHTHLDGRLCGDRRWRVTLALTSDWCVRRPP